MNLDEKFFSTNDRNPCYCSGAIWITRKKIAAYPMDIVCNKKSSRKEIEDSKKMIPYKETVLLLVYTASLDIESIVILWDEKRYVCSNIDAAFDFDIDPCKFNSKNHKKTTSKTSPE